VPLTAIETLGKTLIQGDSTQKTNLHSFLEQLGQSGSNFDKYRDKSKKNSSGGSHKRKRSKNRHGGGKRHSGRSERKAKKLRKLKNNESSTSPSLSSVSEPATMQHQPSGAASLPESPVGTCGGGTSEGKQTKQAMQHQQQHNHQQGQTCGSHCHLHHHRPIPDKSSGGHHPAATRSQGSNGRCPGQQNPKSSANPGPSEHFQQATGGRFPPQFEAGDMMAFQGNRSPSSRLPSAPQFGRNVDPRNLPNIPFPNPSQPFQVPMGRNHHHQTIPRCNVEGSIPLHSGGKGRPWLKGSGSTFLFPSPNPASGEQSRQDSLQSKQQFPFEISSLFNPGVSNGSVETMDESLLSFLNDTNFATPFPWIHSNPLPQPEDFLIDELLVNGSWDRRDQGQEQDLTDSNAGPDGQMLVTDLNNWFS